MATLKKIDAIGVMKATMDTYFTRLMGLGAHERKIAYCSSVGPVELLRALGFEVYFPENHSAMLGTSRMATEVIPFANAFGYVPDICSYVTSDIGSYLKGTSPFQKMGFSGPPKADVLVYNTNQCRDIKDWFEFYAREWKVPCIGIHTPRSIGNIDKSIIDTVKWQLEELVAPLEAVAGQKLDMDKFKEVITLSRRCTELWKAVLETAMNIPTPLTFFDGAIHMGPAVVLRGTQTAIDYYHILLTELEKRIAEGTAAIDGEQHRIYWEGIPIWGKLKNLALHFMEHHTAVVASTYCNSWVFDDLDPDRPFASMAYAYCNLVICRSDQPKEAYLQRMITTYKVDGILYHNAKTCPNSSNGRYNMPRRLQDITGKPFVVIDGDHNDLRLYSEEQSRTKIEAFIEQLAQ